MLAVMDITLDAMRAMAARAGFQWSDDELESLRPAVVRMLEALDRLESLPLAGVEPTTLYRVV